MFCIAPSALTHADLAIIRDLAYRNETSVLIESHNRGAVHLLVRAGLLSALPPSGHPEAGGWFGLTNTGHNWRDMVGGHGLTDRDATLTGVSMSCLTIAADHFAALLRERIGSFRSNLTALHGVVREINRRGQRV